jgi:hypothetical protein
MRIVQTTLAVLCIAGIYGLAAAQTPPVDPKPAANPGAKPAQDPAKPQDPAKKEEPAKQDAKPEEKPAEEAKPKPHKPFTLSLGWADWGLSGNSHKFRQYASPPNGLFLNEFRLSPAFSKHGNQALLTLKALGEDDYRSEGGVSLMHGRTQFEGLSTRAMFFDPTPVVIPDSDRDRQEAYLKQLVVPGIGLSFRYFMDRQNQYFEVPRFPLHQRTRYSDAILGGRLGNGSIGLSLTDWRYFDRTLTLPDTTVQRWRLGYLWTPTETVGVEGSYASSTIKQSGQDSGSAHALSIGGDVAVGPATDVGVTYRRDTTSLPMVLSAYTREQRSATARLSHRWKRWSGQIYLQQREVERLRGDQTFVDVPEWFTIGGRVYGRLNREWRLSLRGYTQDMSHAPGMITQDPRTLLFNSRSFAQIKLDRGTPDFSTYAVYTYSGWENDVRKVRLRMDLLTVGGTWQASPTLNLFAEHTREAWSAQSEITDYSLELFAPNSQITTVGLSWSIEPRTFLSFNYTNTSSDNDNPLRLRDGNIRGSFFTLNARHTFPSGSEVGLVIAPWTYRDQVAGSMNYDAAVFMLTGSTKF